MRIFGNQVQPIYIFVGNGYATRHKRFVFFFRPSLKQILLFFLTNATASRNALSPRFSLFPRIFAKLGPFPFVHNVYVHFSRSSFEKIFHFKRSLENLKIYNYTMYRFHGLFKRFELFSRGIIRKI